MLSFPFSFSSEAKTTVLWFQVINMPVMRKFKDHAADKKRKLQAMEYWLPEVIIESWSMHFHWIFQYNFSTNHHQHKFNSPLHLLCGADSFFLSSISVTSLTVSCWWDVFCKNLPNRFSSWGIILNAVNLVNPVSHPREVPLINMAICVTT